jgi:hypothetical protein
MLPKGATDGSKIIRNMKRKKKKITTGLSKELDKVLEKEELDYSPMITSSQKDLINGF